MESASSSSRRHTSPRGQFFRPCMRCVLCTQLRIESTHLSRCFNSTLIRNCDSIYRIIMTEYVTFHRIVGNVMIKWGFEAHHTLRVSMSNAYYASLFVCVCFLFFALDYTLIYAQCVNKSKLPKTVKILSALV